MKLKPSERVAIIIRIQAAFRGYMARKRIQQLRGSMGYRAHGMAGMMMHNADGSMPANYDNPDVIVSFW